MTTTEQKIFDTARAGGMPVTLSLLLIAQAKHETGNFTSNFFRQYNNAFGYSYVAGGRWQLPGGGSVADNGQPIAAYASVENSTNEIVDWIKRRQSQGKFPADLNTITSPDQYASLLKNAGYFGDTLANYAAGLRSFFATPAGNFSIALGGLMLVGVAYYMTKKKT